MRPLANPHLHAAVIGGLAIQFAAASLPAVSNLLGNADIPVELSIVVSGGAFVSWALSEAIARIVWRTGEAPVPR
jgi:Ca2+-transporting ATPase